MTIPPFRAPEGGAYPIMVTAPLVKAKGFFQSRPREASKALGKAKRVCRRLAAGLIPWPSLADLPMGGG